MTNLTHLQKQLGYFFKHESLLMSALTHRSKKKTDNNERLEFLGDAVLSLIISTELFLRYPHAREGELSRMRASLVKGETIAKIAGELDVGDAVQLGVGESKSGGHQRESILAGAFEAVIGAIYLDSDYDSVKKCVMRWYQDRFDQVDELSDAKDAKTRLQEWLQAKRLALPIYTALATGQAHAQSFEVTCRVPGLPFETTGKSSNRRKAEQIAAAYFLEIIHGSSHHAE